jgi:hypothetical protein
VVRMMPGERFHADQRPGLSAGADGIEQRPVSLDPPPAVRGRFSRQLRMDGPTPGSRRTSRTSDPQRDSSRQRPPGRFPPGGCGSAPALPTRSSCRSVQWPCAGCPFEDSPGRSRGGPELVLSCQPTSMETARRISSR